MFPLISVVIISLNLCFYSCSPLRYSQTVNVSRDGLLVSCDLPTIGKTTFPLIMNIDERWSITPADKYAVFTQEMDADTLEKYNIEAKRREMHWLEKEDYDKWITICKNGMTRHMRTNAEVLFTIPGRVMAFIADSIAFTEIKPQPSMLVASTFFASPYPYWSNDSRMSTYEDITVPLIYERNITSHQGSKLPHSYRTLEYKGTGQNKVLYVIDLFYLFEGKMIYLEYPILGIANPANINNQVSFGKSKFQTFNLDNWLVSAQYINDYCDHLTANIYHAVFDNYKKISR